MSDYIRENAKDFEVVILGVVDAIDIYKTHLAEQMEQINFLINHLGALRDRCTDFPWHEGIVLFSTVFFFF